MKKKLLLLGLFIFHFLAFSQIQDAWVYLTDKENVQFSIDNPTTILTLKAIDRKNAHGVVIDERDVPVNESYISQLKQQTGITVLAKSKWFNAVHIRGTESDINALSGLAFVSNIDFADKSLNSNRVIQSKNKFEIENTQVDYVYGKTNNQIVMINVDDLHLQDFTGEGMTIAVLDASFTNVNTMDAFQRIRENGDLLGGYDFVDRTEDVYEYDPRPTNISHGTRVLSTMAGYIIDDQDDQNNFIGTAPNASYYLFRTEDDNSENPVEMSYWVEAAERADSLGVDVINSSLAYKDFDGTNYDYTAADMDGITAFISKGANIASEKGILVVNSAGNSGPNDGNHGGIWAPADAPGVLTIGAVNASGVIASFSSRGSAFQPNWKPDVVAQGQATYVVSESGSIITNNGTSFSSPITAGAVACLWQALPNASNSEIMDYVRQSASQYLTPDYNYGYGIPDLGLALNIGLSLQDKEILEFIMFPNPVEDILYFKFPNTIDQSILTIYNVLGKVVLKKNIEKSLNSIDVSSLASGLYVISIQSGHSTKSFKLIKS
jgi:serine protease AprX